MFFLQNNGGGSIINITATLHYRGQPLQVWNNLWRSACVIILLPMHKHQVIFACCLLFYFLSQQNNNYCNKDLLVEFFSVSVWSQMDTASNYNLGSLHYRWWFLCLWIIELLLNSESLFTTNPSQIWLLICNFSIEQLNQA